MTEAAIPPLNCLCKIPPSARYTTFSRCVSFGCFKWLVIDNDVESCPAEFVQKTRSDFLWDEDYQDPFGMDDEPPVDSDCITDNPQSEDSSDYVLHGNSDTMW